MQIFGIYYTYYDIVNMYISYTVLMLGLRLRLKCDSTEFPVTGNSFFFLTILNSRIYHILDTIFNAIKRKPQYVL